MTPISFDPRAQARTERRALISNMRAKLTGKAPRNALTIRDEHEENVRQLELDAFRAFNRRLGVAR